jgi:hypothetical protein
MPPKIRPNGQQIILVAKQTPGRARIDPMHEPEKAPDHHPLLRRPQPAEHQQFGRLVQQHDRQRDDGHAAIGDSIHGL